MTLMFEKHLQEWNDYFIRNRQAGHTYSVLNGVLNNPKALIVCQSRMQQNLFPKGKSIMFFEDLRGRKNPVVFDNFTIQYIIGKSLQERIDKENILRAFEKFLTPLMQIPQNRDYIIKFKEVLDL